MPGLFRSSRRDRFVRPSLEPLEERCVPATFVVTNLDDSGMGSLRQAVQDANDLTGQDTIAFQPGLAGTILLTSGELAINDGVDIQGPGALSLTVNGNASSRIFYISTKPSQTTTISGLTLTNGSAYLGGAIYAYLGSLVVDSCIISSNVASEAGGGIYFSDIDSGALTIRNSTLSGNRAEKDGGGGLYFDGFSLLIENSTISGNSAVQGGGVVFEEQEASATIRNSTIAFNTASGNGGGLYFGRDNDGPGTVSVISTIISNNSAGAMGDDVFVQANAGTLNVTDSLILAQLGGDGITGQNTGNIFGVDPGLSPLANNGGPTPTHAITASSAAFNAGSNPQGLAFDQRGPGFARTRSGATDIGAFEVQVDPTPPVNPRAPVNQIAFGLGVGGQGRTASVIGTEPGSLIVPFVGYRGPVRVALGDLNGDGANDFVYSIGGGAAPHVRVISGSDFAVLASFYAFAPGYLGGVSAAVGDVNNDGTPDLVLAALLGSSAVRVVDGTKLSQTGSDGEIATSAVLFSFEAFAGTSVGASVAAGDVNGDGFADIVAGSGVGLPGNVRVYSGRDGGLLASFLPFGAFAGGLSVAAGDVNGDGLVDIVAGTQSGGGVVAVLTATGGLQAAFAAYPPTADVGLLRLVFGGINVGVADVNGDGILDIVTGVQPGSSPIVRALSGVDGGAFFNVLAAPLDFLGGVFVS